MAACQSGIYQLTHRYRRQASSHFCSGVWPKYPALPRSPLGAGVWPKYSALPRSPVGAGVWPKYPALPRSLVGAGVWPKYPALPRSPVGAGVWPKYPALPRSPLGAGVWSKYPALPRSLVGAGLPAIAPVQSGMYQLTHRHREQARSNMSDLHCALLASSSRWSMMLWGLSTSTSLSSASSTTSAVLPISAPEIPVRATVPMIVTAALNL